MMRNFKNWSVFIIFLSVMQISFINCSGSGGGGGTQSPLAGGPASNSDPQSTFFLSGIALNSDNTTRSFYKLSLTSDPVLLKNDALDPYGLKFFGTPWTRKEGGEAFLALSRNDASYQYFRFAFWLDGMTTNQNFMNNGSNYKMPLTVNKPIEYVGSYPLNKSFVFMDDDIYYQNSDGGGGNMATGRYMHFNYTNDHEVTSMVSAITYTNEVNVSGVVFNYYRPDGTLNVGSNIGLAGAAYAGTKPFLLLGQVVGSWNMLACHAENDTIQLHEIVVPTSTFQSNIIYSKVLSLGSAYQLGSCTFDSVRRVVYAVLSNSTSQTTKLIRWNVDTDVLDSRNLDYAFRSLNLIKPLSLQ